MKVRKVLGYPEMARSYPLHHTVSKWADKTIPFLLKNLLAVERPQDSSNSKQRGPVIFFPSIVIQICLNEKVTQMNFPLQCAAFKAFFARQSTLMLIHSFSVQSCKFFVLSAWLCTYFNLTGKGWMETRYLNTCRTSAWGWLVGRDRWGALPWDTMPLLSQSMMTGGMAPSYEKEAAFRINCVIIPPRVSSRYDPADVEHSAQVHLHRYLVIKQYIIVAAELMSGEISFMYDPSWMIIRDCANMPLSIHNPSPLYLRETHKDWLVKCLLSVQIQKRVEKECTLV